MGKIIDLAGLSVGKLVVIGCEGKIGPDIYWRCRCACGKYATVRGSCLRSGHTKSCGCGKGAALAAFNERKANHAKRHAKASGFPRYTGAPCARCGETERYTVDSACVACARDETRDRRRKGGESLKKASTASRNEWKQKNPGRDTELTRARRETPEGRQKFREYMRYYSSIRRCAKLKATPPWVDKAELEAVYRACPEGYHVDHIIPLKHPLVCGLHVPANLQYLPAAENVRKNNTWVAECAS